MPEDLDHAAERGFVDSPARFGPNCSGDSTHGGFSGSVAERDWSSAQQSKESGLLEVVVRG